MAEYKRCGACYFAELVVQDITQRICYGDPPSAAQFPLPDGRITMRMARPIVNVTDRACSHWKPKDAEDVAHDVRAMKALQQDGHETKQ